MHAVSSRIYAKVGGAANWKALLRLVAHVQLQAYLRSHRLEKIPFSRNVVLSGSTLLQISWAESWPGVKTDIFCTEDNYLLVAIALGRADYYLTSFRTFADTDGDPDAYPAQALPFFRDLSIQAVYTWRYSITSPPRGVDVVLAKPGVTDAHTLLDTFDIQACKTSWDGIQFRWPSPALTFTKQSAMEPILTSLLTGFIDGWTLGTTSVDVCDTQKDFLRTDRWKLAALSAVAKAHKFYDPDSMSRLREEIVKSSTVKYWHFFHREMSRVVKYTRRGLVILDLPPFSSLWIGMQHVGTLSAGVNY